MFSHTKQINGKYFPTYKKRGQRQAYFKPTLKKFGRNPLLFHTFLPIFAEVKHSNTNLLIKTNYNYGIH